MLVRRAVREDLGRIQELWWELTASHLVFDPPFYAKRPKKECLKTARRWHTSALKKPGHFILVAEDRHQIVGYLLGAVCKRPPIYLEAKHGMIYSLVVAERWRNRGVAKNLLKTAFSEFRKLKIKLVVLNVDPKNRPGRKLYAGQGFRDRHVLVVKNL